MSDFKTLGIVVKTDAKATRQTLHDLLADLEHRGPKVLLDAESAADFAPDYPALPLDELGAQCDLVLVLGGDGTLLSAGRRLCQSGVPLLGVNLGRLGFMVDIAPPDLATSLDHILAGEYRIEERITLQAWDPGADRAPALVINDVVVRHRRYVRMLDFATLADECFISQHRADGIIISTPTGSTAYALSSGGPMMSPTVHALALVPISPHTLSDRPLIVDANSTVTVEIADLPDNPAIFACDGQIDLELPPGGRLNIQLSPHRLRLVHPLDYDYFGILRNKLRWGRNRT